MNEDMKESITINSKKYTILDPIGNGGFAKVFKVKNENKVYALKKILLYNKDVKKITNEAEMLSKIDNEYIVKYYDSFQDKEYFYIIMEYCDGIDLRKLIDIYKEEGKFMDEQLIYSIVLDICLGIKEIHKNNIIHRDLKPENIFRLKNNKIKIGDFGISRQLQPNEKFAKSPVGTLNYVPPELFKGEYTNKLDIWSLGCIIYELLTLNYCFKNAIEMINKVGSDIRYGYIENNKYNHKWQELIDLLLKKDYNKRPSIDEVYKFLIKNLNNKKSRDISEIKNVSLDEKNKDDDCSFIYWIITSIIGIFLLFLFSKNSNKTIKVSKK